MPQPTESNQPVVSLDQLATLMKQFAAELKAPTADEQAKKDAEKKRREENVRILIQEAKDFHRNTVNTQASCPHFNGKKHTFVGQVFANGDAIAMCSICRMDFKWKATMEQLQQGVDPHQWPSLTVQHLLALEKAYPPTVPAERIKLATQAGKAA